MKKNGIYIYIFTALIMSGSLAGCNPRYYKPVPDAIGSWDLNEKENKALDWTDERTTYNKFVRQIKDFNECGIDPVRGSRTGKNTEAEGYLCIESRGWYDQAGPTCTQWIDFNDPACVAWRKERGLQHMPRPKGP